MLYGAGGILAMERDGLPKEAIGGSEDAGEGPATESSVTGTRSRRGVSQEREAPQLRWEREAPREAPQDARLRNRREARHERGAPRGLCGEAGGILWSLEKTKAQLQAT